MSTQLRYVLQSAFLQLVVVRSFPASRNHSRCRERPLLAGKSDCIPCIYQQSLLNLPTGALQFGHVWMTSLQESMQKGIRQHPNQHLTKKIKHAELNKINWILGFNTTKSTRLRQHIVLRTFGRNFPNIDFFLKSLPLKDHELAMSEMWKPLGVTDFVLQKNMPGKTPDSE